MNEPMCGVAVATEPAVPKHHRLHDAIIRLIDLEDKLKDLNAQINNSPVAMKDPTPENHTPGLQEVLESAPDFMNEKINTCFSLIEELQCRLF